MRVVVTILASGQRRLRLHAQHQQVCHALTHHTRACHDAMTVHDGHDDHDGHDGQGMLQCASTGAIIVDIDAWHGYRSVRVSNKQPS